MRIRTSKFFTSLLLATVTTTAFAATAIQNWSAPGVWMKPAARSGGISAQTHQSTAIPFVPITPCRAYDSRDFTILPAATARTVNVDVPACASYGSAVEAWSVNITVFGSTSTGSYAFLTAYPTGSVRPNVSSLNFLTGSQVGNTAIVAAGTGNDLDIYSTASTHFTIDINGYYAASLPVIGGPTMQFVISTDCGGCAAILGTNNSVSAGSHAVGGFAGGAAVVHGVQGQIGGTSLAGSAGVHGIGGGVNDTAGVEGESGDIAFASTPGFFANSVGVKARGERGLVAAGSSIGLIGIKVDATNNAVAWGAFGFTDTTAMHAQGNGTVSGTLTKGGGAFRIDHPLDPENKYLYHSFVESPDMMNIYNGIAVLDSEGYASVQMPDWFSALNRDFRYQLTSIGRPQPNLYIDTEMEGNHFAIAGGKPGARVSWTVTGIRQDKFANMNRIPLEVNKPVEERGLYLHPEAWGKPLTMSIEAGLGEEMKANLEAREAERVRAEASNPIP